MIDTTICPRCGVPTGAQLPDGAICGTCSTDERWEITRQVKHLLGAMLHGVSTGDGIVCHEPLQFVIYADGYYHATANRPEAPGWWFRPASAVEYARLAIPELAPPADIAAAIYLTIRGYAVGGHPS